ncbi:MAG: GYD domain-containing protein [Candidatus Omnitrophica bacterium]|nr:GYD domain-containing protein [Candidatus Omnitrophota bacterium]
MARFLMLGKYSSEAIKGITKERTKKVNKIIESSSGKVEAMYALLGAYDLAFIVDFPSLKDALKASVEITRLTGIGFSTSPAITVEEFDKLVG